MYDKREESVLTIRKSKRSPRKSKRSDVSPRIELSKLDKLGKEITIKVGNIMKVQNF